MVENLQCPVCTLFLHAGMNLSDHLETHPKEQVIRALVQLTLSGGKEEVASLLAAESKPEVEVTAIAEKEQDLSNCSINSIKSSASSSMSNFSAAASFASIRASSTTAITIGTISCPEKQTETLSPPTSHGPNKSFNVKNPPSVPQAYQCNSNAAPKKNVGNLIDQPAVPAAPADFSLFTANRAPEKNSNISQLQPQPKLLAQPHVASIGTQPQRTSLLPPPAPTAFMHQQHTSANTPRLAHGNPPPPQAQNLKIMYSSALPPPPPLQLFSYQPALQPQHQKPPPAYGTAISQIRSQHNPNKQNATMTQQHHNQHMRVHTPTPSGSSVASSITKDISTQSKLSDNLPTPTLAPPPVQHSFKSFQEAMLYSAAIPTHKSANMLHRSPPVMEDNSPPPPPPPLPPSQQSMQTPIISNRQTSSPFTAVLGTPASPSLSVLRYAESPVAHYMERENGDFIVQESPKHIVQCVEKDNGEFSVIERIYQSPPSVLHIHEDNEDEDEENEDQSNNTDPSKGKELNGNNEQLEEFLSLSRLDAEKGPNSPQTERVNDTFATPAGSTSSQSMCSVSSSANSAGNRKKSSKNSITVLSDVQLDLNEYLDLVGNIIASNKNAKNKARAALFPMVKIEKVEPPEDEDDNRQHSVNEALQMPSAITKATNIPPAIAKKNETEKLVENKSSKDKTSLIETDDEKPTTTKLTQKYPDCQEQSMSAACSSHVTSVIRRATTSMTNNISNKTAMTTTQQRQEAGNGDEHVEVGEDMPPMLEMPIVEDLSQPKSTEYPKVPRAPVKRGPKKLIIKPKLTKVPSGSIECVVQEVALSCANDEQPSTSAKAKRHIMEKDQQHSRPQYQGKSPTRFQPRIEPHSEIFIKNEPNTTGSCSILEQQLKLGLSTKQTSGSPQLSETSDEPNDIKLHLHIKKEINHKYDASYSCSNSNENVTDDARVLLDFANSKKHTSAVMSGNFPSSGSLFGHAVAVANPVTLQCEEEFVANDASDNIVQEIVISSSYSSQSASDIGVLHTANSVSHLTNDSNQTEHRHHHEQHQQQNYSEYPFSFLYGGAGNADAVRSHLSPLYQQSQDITNAATVASGSNSGLLEDSTSAPAPSSHHSPNRFTVAQRNNASQWYHHHHAASTANSDFEAALAVDSSNHTADGVVGKYLDLDACKLEVKEMQSSSSSSFAAATENSLAGGCTTDALNIRTDEKMPAKGEISEQESNCDIENSWSQPMYGDISARFFNGWNHEDYFTVQDLSASTANAAGNTRIPKSFDFRLPLEAPASTIVLSSSSSSNNNMQHFQQHSDSLPSTSKSKKKRKRESSVATKPAIRLFKPTATVTSQQQMLNQQIVQSPLGQAQHQQHLIFQPQYPATSLADPDSMVATAPNSLLLKSRKRIYQCVHCPAEFGKLKDRNLHMIQEHNYVRQNRRLICTDQPTSSTNILATITSSDLATSSAKMLFPVDYQPVEDSKEGIVKIEAPSAELQLSSTVSGTQLDTKTEFIDEKDNLAAVTANTADINAVESDADKKANLQRLVTPAPSTKLTLLYRKLVSYNVMTLKQSQNISEHEEKFIENSIFFCYTCRCNFSCVKTYDAHLSTHPAECFTCGKKFSRWRNFSLHLKRHLGWKEFGCNVCDKKFVVRSALVEHMRMHTGHKPLKCKICGKRFKRYSNLTQHRKRHVGQVVRRKEYVCHCGEVLPSLARFIWHKETHDAKPKCCPYCCDRFVHANSLRRHIRLAHSDKFEYTAPMECPMCKQIFAKSSIKAHMATHSMDTQFDCVICNKSFSTKWNLKIHSWVHANRTAKPFKCEHCPKAFVREVDFKNHMNAHKQIKPYTCEYCGCKFIRKYNYMRHRREHHGNKKFTCDLCKKSFHRHYYLIEHRRIHTGERPFQCTICGKSSTTKTNHNKHLKIHHSRDPFTVEA